MNNVASVVTCDHVHCDTMLVTKLSPHSKHQLSLSVVILLSFVHSAYLFQM